MSAGQRSRYHAVAARFAPPICVILLRCATPSPRTCVGARGVCHRICGTAWLPRNVVPPGRLRESKGPSPGGEISRRRDLRTLAPASRRSLAIIGLLVRPPPGVVSRRHSVHCSGVFSYTRPARDGAYSPADGGQGSALLFCEESRTAGLAHQRCRRTGRAGLQDGADGSGEREGRRGSSCTIGSGRSVVHGAVLVRCVSGLQGQQDGRRP